GWSWSKSGLAVRFEVDASDDATFKFNEQPCLSIDNMLAPVDQADTRFATISSSRTAAMLNAVSAKASTYLADLAQDGKLSPEKVTAANPAMAEPPAKGLEWIVVRAAVDKQ
ncbi:unnamed protein product, partial [Prorocentrum cordatum]